MQELVSIAFRVRRCQDCDFEMICVHNVRDVTPPVRDDVASAVRFGEKRFLKTRCHQNGWLRDCHINVSMGCGDHPNQARDN
jgi:hypothetical protein